MICGKFWRTKLMRIDEFVKYHIEGDGECNGIVLQEWADEKKLNAVDRAVLCYFFAVTYCVESAIIMLLDKGKILENPEKYAEEHLSLLIFQSDRRYMQWKGRFADCLSFFCNNIKKITDIATENPINLGQSVKLVQKWQHFGRFSAYLFLETCAWVMHSRVINTELDWKNGDTATSGLLNVYGLDDIANKFDKFGKLPKELTQERMQVMITPILERIASAGGDNNITKVETSLCAYRKFFKGSRYNGFYLDRMLGEIYDLCRKYPKISQELLEIRSKKFDKKYLGEKNGWKGIRKECKKMYKECQIML